ncbi:hypothetical protein E2C01_063772 [Portunus trituberculatus]|uniref:Uncharacterized protein n=1 Tax=Portunus trituberculatus TaxID=210409 RepID=A0A5B7HLU9_PORTR|nr:hypothetical protein [Portunus trituberculatus]
MFRFPLHLSAELLCKTSPDWFVTSPASPERGRGTGTGDLNHQQSLTPGQICPSHPPRCPWDNRGTGEAGAATPLTTRLPGGSRGLMTLVSAVWLDLVQAGGPRQRGSTRRCEVIEARIRLGYPYGCQLGIATPDGNVGKRVSSVWSR